MDLEELGRIKAKFYIVKLEKEIKELNIAIHFNRNNNDYNDIIKLQGLRKQYFTLKSLLT